MKYTQSKDILQQHSFKTVTDNTTDNVIEIEEIKTSHQNEETISKRILDFDNENMIKGIIFSEIIGKPLSRRRYRR